MRFVMDSSKHSIFSQSLSRFQSPPQSVQFSKPISVSRIGIASALTLLISVPSSSISHGVKKKVIITTSKNNYEKSSNHSYVKAWKAN